MFLKRKFLSGRGVDARYGISSMTRWRGEHDPELKFPKPIVINGRKYRCELALEEFERTRALMQAEETPPLCETLPEASEVTRAPDKPGNRGDPKRVSTAAQRRRKKLPRSGAESHLSQRPPQSERPISSHACAGGAVAHHHRHHAQHHHRMTRIIVGVLARHRRGAACRSCRALTWP
jgi:hypothetical protein